jgi:aldehyde:ferredoxin oxidoreductase
MNHTPAPWTVCIHEQETTVEAESQTVCAFVSNCDANLIAAAPELLALAKAILDKNFTIHELEQAAKRVIAKIE